MSDAGAHQGEPIVARKLALPVGSEMRYTTALGFLLALAPSMAGAQESLVLQQLVTIQGTLSVQSAPQMADGKLTGCSLVYEVLQQDFVYLNGNFVRVSGNVSLLASGQNVALIVKVVAMEVDPAVTDLVVGPLPPSRAYLIDSSLNGNLDSLVTASASDAPGSIFAIYNLEPGINSIFEAIDTGKLTVAFALDGGSMDIQMPIEIDVVEVAQDGSRVRSPNTMLSFLDCAQRLMQSTLE